MPDMSIPSRDADLLVWAQSFATGIENRPAAFALSPCDAQHIRKLVDEYTRALGVATNPATRTSETVNVKDTARNAMVSVLRAYMNGIRANLGVDDNLKLSIGIHVAKWEPTARPCPQTSPKLGLVAGTPGRLTLTYTDSLSQNKAKPFGAHRLELVGLLIDIEGGETVPQGPPANPLLFGSFTRSPMTIEPPAPPKAMHLILWGRWAGARGEVGPWSLDLNVGVISKIRPDASPAAEEEPKCERKRAADEGDDSLRVAA